MCVRRDPLDLSNYGVRITVGDKTDDDWACFLARDVSAGVSFIRGAKKVWDTLERLPRP